MNLMYLPTIIGLIIKYGPYLTTAWNVIQRLTPLAEQIIAAISPIITAEMKKLQIDTSTTGGIVAGVQQILSNLGHPPMTEGEKQNLVATIESQGREEMVDAI